jgi:NADH dehydrogenase
MVRPGVLFGRFDVLVNNIAWVLRRLPVFGVFGDGAYRLRPLHVDDMARLMIREGAGATNTIVDAVGPQRFTYRELVEAIGGIIGMRSRVLRVSPLVGLAVSKAINPIVNDVIITREEIDGLMRGLLDSDAPAPEAATRLTDWAREHRAELGVKYASEVGRRVQRTAAYDHVR